MTAPGTAISSIVVQVDGIAVGNAATGISRPDVCTLFPSRPGCPNVGYAFSLNTSTLSPGGHSITVVATDTDPVPDSGSATVQINVGAVPAVVIEAPTVGAVVAGTINVTGWALDTGAGGTAINSVQVQIDGTTVGTATYGTPRPDVCTLFPSAPKCPNVGYTFALNTANLSPGAHVLNVVATDSDGVPDSGAATQTITVVVPPSVMIDSLTPGTMVSGTVNVSGWAIDSSTGVGTAIGGVQIQVDGTTVGSATYGGSRPDVCTLYPGRPGCPNVGFSYMLNTKSLTPGAHTVTAVATDTDLTPDSGSWSVNVNVGALPTVMIESPVAGSTVAGTVTVSGWALDNSTSPGTAISSVNVSIDGTQVGPAFYGINRPDVCLLYPGRPGCPNVGFTYSLDSTKLSAGSHTITASATDSDSPADSNSTSVTITLGPAHSFSIDTPTDGSVVSGTVMITGWALPSQGTQINAVKVSVDGLHVGLADYGISRPDACAGNPGGYGCPNVGFSFPLDTTTLSAGAHSITVVASVQDGAPPVGYGTVNVTVTH